METNYESMSVKQLEEVYKKQKEQMETYAKESGLTKQMDDYIGNLKTINLSKNKSNLIMLIELGDSFFDLLKAGKKLQEATGKGKN